MASAAHLGIFLGLCRHIFLLKMLTVSCFPKASSARFPETLLKKCHTGTTYFVCYYYYESHISVPGSSSCPPESQSCWKRHLSVIRGISPAQGSQALGMSQLKLLSAHLLVFSAPSCGPAASLYQGGLSQLLWPPPRSCLLFCNFLKPIWAPATLSSVSQLLSGVSSPPSGLPDPFLPCGSWDILCEENSHLLWIKKPFTPLIRCHQLKTCNVFILHEVLNIIKLVKIFRFI